MINTTTNNQKKNIYMYYLQMNKILQLKQERASGQTKPIRTTKHHCCY